MITEVLTVITDSVSGRRLRSYSTSSVLHPLIFTQLLLTNRLDRRFRRQQVRQHAREGMAL